MQVKDGMGDANDAKKVMGVVSVPVNFQPFFIVFFFSLKGRRGGRWLFMSHLSLGQFLVSA